MPICSTLLSSGVCSDPSCAERHDIFSCNICRVFCSTSNVHQSHLRGKRHAKRINRPVRCSVCALIVGNASAYQAHAQTTLHISRLAQQGLEEDPGPMDTLVPVGFKYCETCDTNIPNSAWRWHIEGKRHRSAQTTLSYTGAVVEAERDKNGVSVHDGKDVIDFPFIEMTRTSTLTCVIKNANPTPIRLLSAKLTSSWGRGTQSRFSVNEEAHTIEPNGLYGIFIVFSAGERGRFEDRVELIFQDTQILSNFGITRPVHAIVGVAEDYALLKPIAPYVRRKHNPGPSPKDVVPGEKPPALAAIEWAVPLPQYHAHKPLIDAAYGPGTVDEAVENVRNKFMPKVVNTSTYGRFFGNLLWLEEERARRDLQQYNLEGEQLIAQGPYYRLEVAGLAEKRPSLIVTDRVFVRNYGSPSDKWFEGFVHRVQEKSVDLKFHHSFHSYRGQKYDVRFDLNRLVYRRMHQALGTAFNREEVLFPTKEHVQSSGLKRPTSTQKSAVTCLNRKIQTNNEQLEVVASIVNRPRGAVPFVVFGPPGTGKTVTIVEAIHQLVKFKPGTRILACAPSNSAADLLTLRLSASHGTSELFRLIAPSRGKSTIPSEILPYTLSNPEGTFCTPSVPQLLKYSIIVCTCASASVLHGVGVPRGHFSEIFVDEAGQSYEPEVMIGIKTLADNSTNVVLAGDPKQLGPIVRSAVSRELGLEKSYLDRLMEKDVYQPGFGDGITFVKLLKNWRSHESIVKFPNERFYNNELQACADPTITESMLRYNDLPKEGFPVIFHGISGKDEREASSPSFFNIDEASLVKKYVESLFEDRRFRLTADHIGIISPYNAQVGKIRKLLKNKDIKVGSVEEFQGQERRIIIISTVRSSVSLVDYDLRHTLGFVANPRRFNVAITRAQALLIVIGDPSILSIDPFWKSFINFIHIRGGCHPKGKRIDWNPRDPVQFDEASANVAAEERATKVLGEREGVLRRVRVAMIQAGHHDSMNESLRGTLNEDLDVEEVEVEVERPWRVEE